MILLLLPLVAAILLCERHGLLYPSENALYDSLYVHTFVLTSDHKPTARCERYEADTYGGKIYLYLQRDSLLPLPQTGDTIIAQTRIRHLDSIGNFNYRKYALRQGFIGSAFASRYEIHPAVEHPIPLQKRLYQRIAAAGLQGDELATVGALTLGYKEDLDPELKQHFQASGAAHVLAVSGLHTGILYGLILWLLTLGGRIKPLHKNRVGRCFISTIIIAVMWGYAWLTGMTPSVVRAVLMVTMFEIGRMLYRQAFSVNTIAAAAVLILLIRPLDLWSVSFQLSFAATISIVILAKWAETFLHTQEWNYVWYGRILAWFSGTIIISLAAQIGTLPITMHYFGQVSSYFLLANLIVLPIATLLVPCGLISIALGGSSIGVIFSHVTDTLAWLMNHSVAWIEALPGSTFPASVNGGMIALYYLLLALFYAIVVKKRV